MLELLGEGWNEGPNGMLCKAGVGGGIIDQTIATGTWFVVFNDKDEVLEDLETRDDAITAFFFNS